jgi:hypothetical protein
METPEKRAKARMVTPCLRISRRINRANSGAGTLMVFMHLIRTARGRFATGFSWTVFDSARQRKPAEKGRFTLIPGLFVVLPSAMASKTRRFPQCPTEYSAGFRWFPLCASGMVPQAIPLAYPL